MGISTEQRLHRNLTPTQLYEHALRRGEGIVTNSRGGGGGPFAAMTSPHTGRSPNDKFLVEEPDSTHRIWWGKVNQPIAPEKFERLKADVEAHLSGQELFVRDVYACADPHFRLPIRFVTPNAWHALFVYNMFLRPADGELSRFAPGFEVLHAPEFHADPRVHGTRSGTFIIVSFAQRTILIGGTRYAGELKKSIFTILNYLLPLKGVLSMHCSANVGKQGDCALFFGLLGTVRENVDVNPTTGAVDLNSQRITENTRASYPIHYIPNHVPEGMAGHPKHIVFLTCDAFGVMPPIAQLTPEQAMYHFLSGYTAKVAGTERGVTEPKETFSACFGAPFLPLPPTVYAKMLGERIERHRVQCWLVNTGWTGGPYGVGHRMDLKSTRAMIRAALAGQLDRAPTRREPIFGLEVPTHVPGVSDDLLDPRTTWKDPATYDAQAEKLTALFRKNFEQFATQVPRP